jgi:hypothetical protein
MSDVRSRSGHKIKPQVKTFVVLGMHRSATSLVSEGLERAGVCMGDANRSKVHWEDMRFMRLNDRILKAAGGSWHNPPCEEAILCVRSDFVDELYDLVADEVHKAVNGGYFLWGWKDPRTVLTAKLYAPLIPRPHWITVFRDPVEVAHSLQRRNKFPLEKGAKLAMEYNKRIIGFMEDWYRGEKCTGRRTDGDCGLPNGSGDGEGFVGEMYRRYPSLRRVERE